MDLDELFNVRTSVWSVCHNPSKNLWQAISITEGTIQAKGKLVKGKSESYDSLSVELNRMIDGHI